MGELLAIALCALRLGERSLLEKLVDFVLDLFVFGSDLIEVLAFGDARPGVFGDGKPAEFEIVLFVGDQVDEFSPARMFWESIGIQDQSPVIRQWFGDDRLAGSVRVNTVGGKGKVRVGFSGFDDG